MIKTLRDRMRFPRLGMIGLGVKEVSAKGIEYPRETDYFVLPQELRHVYGERPKKLPVLFPSDDVDRVFETHYLQYAGKLLRRKCDGEQFVDMTEQETRYGPCERNDPGCKCKMTGRLNVILPKARFGIYQIVMRGDQRVADVMSELELYRDPRVLGRLTDILFELERVPTERQVRQKDGSRLPVTGYPVHVRCNFTAQQIAEARKIEFALPPAMVEEEDDVVEVNGEADAAREPLLEPKGEMPVVTVPASTPPSVELGKSSEPGAPVTAGGRESAPLPSGGILTGPAFQPDDGWDISLCFKEAVALGVTARAYELYLLKIYSCDKDNLSAEDLAEQAALLQKAKRDAKVAEAMKAAIIAGANKASREQGSLFR